MFPSRTLNAEYCAFLAQQELVTIMPLFTLDSISLLSGNFGPFRLHHETSVPLWLALLLRKSKVCIIRPPAWLGIDSLQIVLRYEKNNDSFYALPHYATEITSMLLNECEEDFGSDRADLIGKLVGEILIHRWTKVLRDLEIFRTSGIITPGVRVTNLIASEFRRLRPIMLRILDDGADFELMYHKNLETSSERSSTFTDLSPTTGYTLGTTRATDFEDLGTSATKTVDSSLVTPIRTSTEYEGSRVVSTRATTSEGVLTDSASRPTGHSGDRLQDETQPSRRRDEAENPLDTLEEYTPVRPSHTRRRRTLRDI